MASLARVSLGSGPLVLLLHPVGLDKTFWDPLPARLSDRFEVMAVDLAGHGESPPAARPGSMEDRVADIAGLIESTGRGRACVLGVSFGGMIAQNLALARPELVSALVLTACPGRIAPEARETLRQRGADAEANGMEAILDATLRRWFTEPFLSTEVVARVRERLLANSVSGWAAAWEAIATHDALDQLHAVKVPTLVVAGEHDLSTPVEAKRALAAAVPGSRLEIIPGAPHMLQIECAETYAGIVSAFLDEHRQALQ